MKSTNVLQFMILYIIGTPLLELKSVGKSVDYTQGKTVLTLYENGIYIYYRFIVCFPIGLDFLFITFLLQFFMDIFSVNLKFCHVRLYTLQPCPSWSSNQFSAVLLLSTNSHTLASGGSLKFLFVVHQPASPSIWPAEQSLRRGLSTNPGVTMWCVCGCS